MLRTSILSVWLTAGLVFALWGADAPLRSSASSDHWTGWRGPNREGISPDTGLSHDWNARPPKHLWTTDGVGEGFASMAVVDGRLYTTGAVGSGQAVTCLSAADGKLIWQSKISDVVTRDGNYKGSKSTPTIDGERLYAISTDGKLACLNTADGKVLWTKDFKQQWNGRMMSGWGYAESALVDGERVLCTPGGTDAMLVALDKVTGQEIWRSKVPSFSSRGRDGAGYSSIVISSACGIKQYVQFVGRGVIGVRASDGKLLWSYDGVTNGTANIPTPIVSGDYVFCSSGYSDGGAALLKLLRAKDGVEAEEVYHYAARELQNHHGQMVLKDGYVYFGHRHGNGFPVCVELESGKIVWGGTQRGPGSGSAAIIYADGHLVFRYQNGEVALIEATPEEYRLKGHFQPDYVSDRPCWSHPVVIGGRLYLRDQDKLMCYDARG